MSRTPLLLSLATILATGGCVEGRIQQDANAEPLRGSAPSVQYRRAAPEGSAFTMLLAALAPQRGAGRIDMPAISTDALAAAAGRTHAGRGNATSCPPEMVLVTGQYCPDVEQKCIRWLETSGRYAYFRCAEYMRPAKCLTERKAMRFCMDRNEYVPPGASLPASGQSWTDATRICGSQGKRLCMESEWNFACEGEEMRPYPYGFTRDAEVCNADRVDIYRSDGELRDLRDGPSGHPGCVSPFGVHHLSGNLEEWTTIDGTSPARPAMKGAYWQPSRNHCRAAQTAHDTYYNGTETGFRCCKGVD